jgi:glycogen(starch) synthase
VIVNGIADVPRNPSQVARAQRWTLVCVGRLEPEKGFDLAIEALARVRARGTDVGLTVIGQGVDWERIGRLTEELGLEGYVHFTGPLGNAATRAEIAQATAVLVPSRTREGFSLVAAEAAMAGVPVIATSVGGLPETVRDGETGFIIPPDDVSALAAAVMALLDDDERRERLGKFARQRATEIFDLSTCAESYAALYRSLLA